MNKVMMNITLFGNMQIDNVQHTVRSKPSYTSEMAALMSLGPTDGM